MRTSRPKEETKVFLNQQFSMQVNRNKNNLLTDVNNVAPEYQPEPSINTDEMSYLLEQISLVVDGTNQYNIESLEYRLMPLRDHCGKNWNSDKSQHLNK